MDQRAFRAERQDIAGEGISLRILVAEVVDRIPAADIGPAHVDRRDRHTISLLDDGIVYGEGGGGAERFRVGADMDAVPSGELERPRSEEHTSELQSLMRISYAVFCL